MWDSIDTHADLITKLSDEYDAWALSMHTPALKTLLPLCPDDIRVMAWVKPWASFKPGVGVAYAWEPIIIRGGRTRTKDQDTVRDWISANATMKKGMPGAKPVALCFWLFNVLNLHPDDNFTDLFPGSGVVSNAWEIFRTMAVQQILQLEPDLTL
jgi:hypothetical protein